ncbi:hypothetical protein GEV33_012014 [Tenebrio molitor]|uniref:Uncharacterized protein n=1 Tax=Tenebrio molitor TaxID=7067 RepID=A0A8J6HAD8_TENMO|nr:hypothetical protein GEV33_012014 [Tenebrio molitor]
MIFGLLSLKIRKRLARNSIRTFDELLQKAREAEETFEEEERERLEVKTSHTPQTDDKQKRPERPRCLYCKKFLPGRSNVLADILSRPTIPDETDQSCELCPVEIEYPRLAA